MINKKKRIEVTQMQIDRLKQSLKEKDSKNIDPRLAKAAKIQTEVLIQDLEKELQDLSK